MILWSVTCWAPLSMGFFRQEYWRGLPCPPPGNLPDPGAEPTSPVSPALQADYFITEPPGKPSASVLSKSIQCWFPLGQTGLVTLQSKGLSKVFSSTTIQKHQFCGAPALFVVPTLISICDYWKKHSFDSTDLCWRSDVFASYYVVSVCHSFSSKKQESSNFMAAVTICSEFGA